MYKLFFIALILLSALATPAAAAELDRAEADNLFGEYRLVRDTAGRLWTRDEWETGKPPAQVAEYGHLTVAGDRNAAVWLEYGRDGFVRKFTAIVDRPISLREFGRYFPFLGEHLADAALFLVRGYPRDGLAAVISRPHGDVLVTFHLADSLPATRLNTHSPVRWFTVVKLTAADKELIRMADKGDSAGARDGSWQRLENFLKPGLHFSEPLIARRLTDMIVVHHTKIPAMTVASIHDFHLSRGWAGIGYHKVILPDGTVADGRPEYAVGAHALGVNGHSVGIVLVGDFDVSLPSSAQLRALVALTVDLARKYGVSPDRVVGHRDVFTDTTCPGRIFPWAEFKQALKAKLAGQ